MTTLNDLYPDGRGYHRAHEAYIQAVHDAFAAADVPVRDWHADPNDPRDGAIEFDVTWVWDDAGRPAWSHDEVWAGWSEDRGWHLLTVDDPHGRDSRFVYELHIGRVPSPETVVNAVAEKAGVSVQVPAGQFEDVDFPDHTFENEDPAFEHALAVYRQAAP